MKRPLQPISLAGSQLGDVRHVCAFFANDEEEYRVLIPFIREGLSRKDKGVHIINPEAREEHLQRLAAAGIDSTSHQQSGQLQVRDNTEVYLRDGNFDPDRMLAEFEEIARSARTADGYSMCRIVCRMDWASGDSSHIEDVIEVESRVNDVWRRFDDVVVCTYNLAKINAAAVVDIIRTHPMVIIGGHLQHNPFFTPPEEFLLEYRQRRSGRTNP